MTLSSVYRVTPGFDCCQFQQPERRVSVGALPKSSSLSQNFRDERWQQQSGRWQTSTYSPTDERTSERVAPTDGAAANTAKNVFSSYVLSKLWVIHANLKKNQTVNVVLAAYGVWHSWSWTAHNKGPKEYPPKPQFGLLAPVKAIFGNAFYPATTKNMHPRFQAQHSYIKPHCPLWSGLRKEAYTGI